MSALPAHADPRAVTRKLFRARGAGDLDAVMRLLAPAVEVRALDGAVYRGLDEVRAYLAADLDRVEVHGRDFIVDGDTIVVTGRLRRFTAGSFSDGPACWRCAVAGGRVTYLQAARSVADLTLPILDAA